MSVGTIERLPFVYYDEDKKLTGFAIELWEEIARDSNFTYKYSVEKNFSDLIKNTYTKYDISVANISITSDREKKADFFYSFFESGMAIAVKKGVEASIWKIIVDSGIFTFLLISFLVLLFVAHVIWFFERNIEEGKKDYFRDDYRHGIFDAFWWAFLVLVMGELEEGVSKRVLNRVLAAIWIIVSLFFISTITAKITTSMTVAKFQSDIKSYHDLVGLKVGVTKGSSHEKFLRKKGIGTVAFNTLDELYSALRNEKVEAIVADYPILSYYATHDGAKWMMLTGEVFNHESYGFMFKEGSPYVEQVNRTLLKLRENGFYEKLYNKYFKKEK